MNLLQSVLEPVLHRQRGISSYSLDSDVDTDWEGLLYQFRKSEIKQRRDVGAPIGYRALPSLTGVSQKVISEMRGTPTRTCIIKTSLGNVKVALYKRLNNQHKVKTFFYFLHDKLFAIGSHYPYATSGHLAELSKIFLKKLRLEGSYELSKFTFADPEGWVAYSSSEMGFQSYIVHAKTLANFLKKA